MNVSALLIACGGLAAPDVANNDASRDQDADGAGQGDATGVSDAAQEQQEKDSASTEGGCSLVGSGPGLETCCNGQMCHGECNPAAVYACSCNGSVCPPNAACCFIETDAGGLIGPYCVAVKDCALP